MLNRSLDRGRYALAGLVLFALKYNLDRILAEGVYKRKWSFETYFYPAGGHPIEAMAGDPFYAAMLALALPFILIGVLLTLWRLNSIGWPGLLVLLFFVPAVNLLFFCVLCVMPERPAAPPPGVPQWQWLSYLIPRSTVGAAAVSVFLVLPPALISTVVGADVLKHYGWGLFVGIPFAVGLASVLLYAWHGPRRLGECLAVATLAITICGFAVVVVALEGILCVAMAAPLAWMLAMMGALVGYAIQKAGWRRFEGVLVALLAAVPLLLGAEAGVRPDAPPLPVTTSIDIDAPPEVVWSNVVAFSRLPPPDSPLSRLGVAYPVRARIQGRVRYCEFSTGPFVEPITVWDPPRVLAFGVTSQPPPMEEWSPYAGVVPPHIEGYLESERGQFLLVPLPGGRTRVEGTTWYRNRMWPMTYWRLWSDALIHDIHGQVLRHVKRSSES